MKKIEFIEKLSSITGESKVASECILNAVTSIIENELLEGGDVSFIGVGKLKVKTTKARKGRNPKTGKEIQNTHNNSEIMEQRVIIF